MAQQQQSVPPCLFDLLADLLLSHWSTPEWGKLRPGAHTWPGELFNPARRASHSFLQKPNEKGCQLDWLEKGSEAIKAVNSHHNAGSSHFSVDFSTGCCRSLAFTYILTVFAAPTKDKSKNFWKDLISLIVTVLTNSQDHGRWEKRRNETSSKLNIDNKSITTRVDSDDCNHV